MTSKEALKIAISEYEKDLITDKNNEWVKSVLKGLKECQQDLEKLEKVIEILKKALLLNVKEVRGIYYVLGYDTNYCLTKEEYELLKGVLEK